MTINQNFNFPVNSVSSLLDVVTINSIFSPEFLKLEIVL